MAVEEIEHLFRNRPRITPDWKHAEAEERFIAVGRSLTGRPIFVAFTLREKGGTYFIRPISARNMHKKESDKYEETEKKSPETKN